MNAPADLLHRFAAQEETWPAAERRDVGDGAWRLRADAAAAGHRVTSARPLTTDLAALEAGIAAVEGSYETRGADCLFQLPTGSTDDEIGALLRRRGFAEEAPTACLAVSLDDVAAAPLADTALPYWIAPETPLAVLDALWDEGGIGPARRAVMARAPRGRRIAVRRDNRLVGAAFIGISQYGAVLHALSVKPAARRRGAGRDAVVGGARWATTALGDGGDYLIDVEEANAPALALYTGLGARKVGGYRYYRKPTA